MAKRDADHTLKILVVDDELNIRKMLATSLELDGHEVAAVSNADDALDQISRTIFDIVFLDLQLGRTSGIDLIPQLLATSPTTRVVIITAHGSVDTAVETMRLGATDYLLKPFTPAQIRIVTDRIARVRTLEQQVAGLEGLLSSETARSDLTSENPTMRGVFDLARKMAKSNSTILLRGESGTGKGLIARAIHQWSDRANHAFATVSTPMLTPQLLESELFGHAKGAFTGAVRDNPGRVAVVDGGTLFLDEIGDLPRELQPKLLRFIQDREYERVGEAITRRADVRIVAATNIDLDQAVKDGKFREDLFYRINVIPIHLPPLRERAEDIPMLVGQFLSEFRRGGPAIGVTAEAIEALKAYHWPGNIRELRNVIERAVILAGSGKIDIEHLAIKATPKDRPVHVGDAISVEKLTELHIRRVLAQSKSMDEAAEILGIDVATLYRRRKKYGI